MIDNVKYVFTYIWNDKRLRYYILASLLIVIFMVIFVTASDAAVVEEKETLPRDKKVEIPVPSVLTHASAICREKYLPEGYNINNGNSKAEAQSLSPEITDSIDGCIKEQIESSTTILTYMKTINSWWPSPAKVIMEAVVGSCFQMNVDRDGNIDYTAWLECIRAKVKLLEQEIDRVMDEMKKEKEKGR